METPNESSSCRKSYRRSGAFLHPDWEITFPIQSTNLVYIGANLPYSGVNTCDTLTIALQKIDEKLGALTQTIYNLTTTTTTIP